MALGFAFGFIQEPLVTEKTDATETDFVVSLAGLYGGIGFTVLITLVTALRAVSRVCALLRGGLLSFLFLVSLGLPLIHVVSSLVNACILSPVEGDGFSWAFKVAL